MPGQPNPPARHSTAHECFGSALRETRARFDLSQEELGFQCGLHRNYVGALERGEINPTFRILLKLSYGLQLPLSEIIGLYEQRLQQTLAARKRDEQQQHPPRNPHAQTIAHAEKRSSS